MLEEILGGKNKECFKGLAFPTRDTPIENPNDPVLFADAITTAFARQGSWTMPPDITYIGLPPSPREMPSFP